MAHQQESVDRILLRIPTAMRKWVEAQAKHHLRSRNGQILSLIKAAQMAAEQQKA
jgi:hypothetical protein